MRPKILFITPPFTQLNTAYPASAYLKGFLEEQKVSISHCDLCFVLFTSIFTGDFLGAVFEAAANLKNNYDPEVSAM
jgi:hypothetical protein